MGLLVNIEVREEDLASSLAQINHDELVSLIVQIDANIADCGFSESLLLALCKACKVDTEGFDHLGFIDWTKV